MKPEARASQTINVELNEDEKVIVKILEGQEAMELNAVKQQSALSGKKWDKAIKNLTKNNIVKVEKTDAGLFVKM